MSTIADMPPLREVLKQHGLSANKKLGQHFLFDLNITDKIASLTGPLEGKHVIEVGPGPGGLTRSLLMGGAERIFAIEMDARFVPLLTDIRNASEDRLEIVMGDGIKLDPATLTDVRPLRIAANLPYNVGTKMLINWLIATPLFWDRLVLMFQKEVAERVVARPGDKAYGRLAILSQSIANAHMAFDVPARCFTPPPKVDSAVVVLHALPDEERFDDLKSLSHVTAAAFNQRRKMLRRSLKGIASENGLDLDAWLKATSVDPQARPETLPVSDFHKLTRYMTQNRA